MSTSTSHAASFPASDQLTASPGLLRESIALHLENGVYTARTFDAGGNETSSKDVALAF